MNIIGRFLTALCSLGAAIAVAVIIYRQEWRRYRAEREGKS